jgi:uncharacterized membrane protein
MVESNASDRWFARCYRTFVMAIAVDPTRTEQPRYRRALFPMVAVFAVLAFLAAPWPLAEKAHALLHGLCAQRPSHSFVFGGRDLPFDARMTGIYAGFCFSAIVLVARGRHRAGKLPRLWVIGVLALLGAAMALDGFNSLFLDLNLPTLYPPSNALRLATGLGVGIALAVAICYLVAISLWRQPRMDETAVDGRGLLVLIAAQAPALAFLTGWPSLYAPLTLLLLCSAVAVISLLALVTLVMALKADNSFAGPRDVQEYASGGLVLGLIVIALLAGVRFLYERHFGPSPLT